jgi:hypothetical protein
MASSPQTNPAACCPLCGGDNRCAMELARATGEAQAPCWCVNETFPPELMATLPDEARGKACICISCLRAHAQKGTS